MGGGGGGGGWRVLQVFTLEGTRNEINRNDCIFYKTYTFISKVCINLHKCFNNLILSHSARK